MSLDSISAGDDAPEAFNVVIEIPMRGDPVKYEVDKHSGVLMVDRIMSTAMHYPTNYGYVPATLAEDGDPVDAMVLTPVPLLAGSVVECRAIGILAMSDEKGEDHKVLAVPVDKVSCDYYREVQGPEDVPQALLQQIGHFFEHYKDLEKGKWVKIGGWQGAEPAREEIRASIARYRG